MLANPKHMLLLSPGHSIPCYCLRLQKFEELMSKYDKDDKGGLTYKVCHNDYDLTRDGFAQHGLVEHWLVLSYI